MTTPTMSDAIHRSDDFAIVPFVPELAPAIADYFARNREHLAPWEPPRPDDFFTESYWQRRVLENQEEARLDRNHRWAIVGGPALAHGLPVDLSGRVIGTVGLSNVVRGPLQTANLGAGLDRHAEGRGLMYRAAYATLTHGFDVLGLHRIEAGHRVENTRSARLVARLGFERIGHARRYLLIAGEYRDHVLYQKLEEDHDRGA